jgi:hypothetical protein
MPTFVVSESTVGPAIDEALSRADDVVSRAVEGGALLVHLERGDIWELNQAGAQVWELLDGQHTLRAIGEHLAARYGVPLAAAENDVLVVVRMFMSEGLLRIETRSP